MNITKEEYAALVRQRAKKSPLGRDMAWAFLVGGAICTLGQYLLGFYRRLGLDQDMAGTAVSVTLIGAAALMRPSKSVTDMELKSLKKKYKDKKFAAGCSRDVIANGAQLLGWELDRLLGDTLEAMRAEEQAIEQAVAEAGAKDVDL